MNRKCEFYSMSSGDTSADSVHWHSKSLLLNCCLLTIFFFFVNLTLWRSCGEFCVTCNALLFLTAGPVWLWCLRWHRNPRGISVSCFSGPWAPKKSPLRCSSLFNLVLLSLAIRISFIINLSGFLTVFSQLNCELRLHSCRTRWLSKGAAPCMRCQDNESERDSLQKQKFRVPDSISRELNTDLISEPLEFPFLGLNLTAELLMLEWNYLLLWINKRCVTET